MSAPKALRLSVARVADDTLGLALAVIGATQEVERAADFKSGLQEGGLMLLFDGPSGASGGAVLSLEMVSALIQQQTTGTVSKMAPDPRPMTATDAALCAPFLEAVLARSVSQLETAEDRQILEGYRFGARADGKRLFEMALQASDYNVIRLTVDIAGGLRQATVTFCTPVEEPRRAPPPPEPAAGGEIAVARSPLQGVVMSLPAELAVVLCKVRLPLARLGELAPGVCIPLPADAFPEAQVAILGGRVLARGVLGQMDGKRALRLTSEAAGKTPQQGEMSGGTGGHSDFAGGDDDTLDMPGYPQPEGLGDVPDMGDLPDLADLGHLPELDGLSEAGGGGTLSELPDLSDMPDFSDLPGFEDLPETGDLPDLEGLPKFNIA